MRKMPYHLWVIIVALLSLDSVVLVYALSSEAIITTVAGTTAGLSGDNGSATAAQLNNPSWVAMDGASNLYIADQTNHRIRKVIAATGVITTVAGTTPGLSGDNGPAIAAQLTNPSGVALDGLGNLYIAEFGNHRIRKVIAATSVITTVAGTTQGFSGDNGPATAAQLNYPSSLTLDIAGNLYIADWGNHRIRKVIAATGVITTVTGTTQGFSGDNGLAKAAQLHNPSGVAVDGLGNLYIADQMNHRIRKVIAATGVITTVAGTTQGFSGDNGPATAAQLDRPTTVVLDGAGNLYIADTGNARIRKLIVTTGVITTIAGTAPGFSGDNGPATAAQLLVPSGLALDTAGTLYIADLGNHRIRKVADPQYLYLPVILKNFDGSTGEHAADLPDVFP